MISTTSVDPDFFSDLARPTSFFIARHGETAANAESRIQGRSEFSLNETGRAQACDLASYLSAKGVRRLLHSPQARAAQTAAIVASGLGLEAAEPEPLLMELDTGRFTGLTWDEIRERYPEEYEAFGYRSWEAVPDAESAEELYRRAVGAWGRLKAAAADAGGNVAAVSHGGTIQWLVRVTFGCRAWMPLFTTGNCGVFELRVSTEGAGRPAYMQWKEVNFLPGGEASRTPPVF
ncbi:MAG: histidine phosphatase family protein [Spirochaetes bacterium]|nr:histidine phosphatase family protein [Spirochaetota bacterium]MBU1081711.1 histidine phosphatase family protein [Spirochaetota bacterium]